MRGNHYDMKAARAILADVNIREAYRSSVPMYELEDFMDFDRMMYDTERNNRRRTYGR